MRRVHVVISGRVQGVGFRYHTRQTGERLALTGWVRNCPDGTVEVEAEGPGDSVEDLLAWLRTGPAGAHVEAARTTDREAQGGAGFVVRY